MILSESEILVKVHQQLKIVYFAMFWSVIAIWLAWHTQLFNSFKPAKSSAINGFEVIIGFCLFIFSQIFIIPILIAVIYYLATGNEINFNALSQSMQFWVNIIIVIGGYIPIVIFYVYVLSKDQKKSVVGDSTNKWYQNYLFGASTWFLIFPLILLWSRLIDIFIMIYFHETPSEQLPVKQVTLAIANPVWMIIMGLMISGIVPIGEEFLFRGLLQSWIKKKFNSSVLGVIIASIIFAVFHFSSSQDVTNIQFISSIFLLSCFLMGFLYEREKSLWASIGLHMLLMQLVSY